MSASIKEKIKDRFETGFSNWNSGYEAWLEWCNTLYEPDAFYNVNSNRLTLQQYKDLMKDLLAVYDIQLGKFHNMLIEGNWGAIRYEVFIINKATGEKKKQETMEFVNFKENPDPIGVRVVEGWALSDTPLSAD